MVAAWMPVEQALVWLKTTAPDIPDARLYGFQIRRRDGIFLPLDYNGRRWVFSHTHQEKDLASGLPIDWLVFTEQGTAHPAGPGHDQSSQF